MITKVNFIIFLSIRLHLSVYYIIISFNTRPVLGIQVVYMYVYGNDIIIYILFNNIIPIINTV